MLSFNVAGGGEYVVVAVVNLGIGEGVPCLRARTEGSLIILLMEEMKIGWMMS